MYNINNLGRMGLTQSRSFTFNLEALPQPDQMTQYADAVTLCHDAEENALAITCLDNTYNGTDVDPRPMHILTRQNGDKLEGMQVSRREINRAARLEAGNDALHSTRTVKDMMVRSDDGAIFSMRSFAQGQLQTLHEYRRLADGKQEEILFERQPDGTVSVTETLR